MFKKLFILALAVLSISACCQKATPKVLDTQAFAEQALTSIDFGDEVVPLSENVIADFYNLQFEGLEEVVVYTSGTRATASEIAVFRVADKDAMAAAKAAVEARLGDQKESYENYRPDEMVKLNAATIKEDGNYLLFAVTPDNDTVVKLFNENLK